MAAVFDCADWRIKWSDFVRAKGQRGSQYQGPTVMCVGHISDETNSTESVVRRRAQGTNARAVIKFVSRAKRSALFDLPTAQRCVCVMRWAAKEFVCAARWWMVVAGGRWAYCILISAFSKRIVYPHGCLLYLSANMNKWTNDSMYQWFSDWMQDTNEWALATNDQPLTSLLFTVQSRRWESQKEISEIGDSI